MTIEGGSMPLNDKQTKAIVKLVDSVFLRVRQGALAPENIAASGILDELLSGQDKLRDIPRDLVCKFLLLLFSDNKVVPLYELLQGIGDAHQLDVKTEYTNFVKELFNADEAFKLQILGEFKKFIARVKESSAPPSTPKKQVIGATQVTPNTTLESPESETAAPEKKSTKKPTNLHEMLDSLHESLNDFEYVPKRGTPKKIPNNKMKLNALTKFLTPQAVEDISKCFLDENEDLDQLKARLNQLNVYCVGLEKLAALCIELLPQKDNQEVGSFNQELQKNIKLARDKILNRIEELTPPKAESIEPIAKESPAENKPYVALRFYREKDRVREIHNIDSGGHLLLIVNYLDDTGQYKKRQLTLKRSDKILEKRNYPPEIQVHKLFSRNNIPSGDILEGYFLSEDEIKEIDDRYRKPDSKAIIKEVRLEQEGIDYQVIGKAVTKCLDKHPKGSANPFPYCFYRNDDADNCASLIYKLLASGGTDKYAKLKKEWGHITPKNVFVFCKEVEVALSKLALAKSQMQTQADYIAAVAGKAYVSFASEFGTVTSDITDYKTSLDAGKPQELSPISELNNENSSHQIAGIIKQLYLFAHLLRNTSGSKQDELSETVITYLSTALGILSEFKTLYPEKEGFSDSLFKMIEELQRTLSNKHRLFPLTEVSGLGRLKVEEAVGNLTQNAEKKPLSIMYTTLQQSQKEKERSNIPVTQITDEQVFAAVIAPPREVTHEAQQQDQQNLDEYELQIAHVLDLVNTDIHTNPKLLGNEAITAKYQRIMQLLSYFKVIYEINFDGKNDLRKNLFALAMNIRSTISQVSELKTNPIDGVPDSFYDFIVKQMQAVVGKINQLIYFDIDSVKDPTKSNLNLTSELSVLLRQDDIAPVSVEEVLKQAEKTMKTELPADKPASVHAECIKDVSIPQRHWSDGFKFWDYDSNWYAEVDAKKSVAAILKNKKLSGKQQQQTIRKVISDAKPSILKVWRWAEYDRYTELERQAETICLTKSFIQGESDEVDFMTDLLLHFKDYPSNADYHSQINPESGNGAPLLDNLFNRYQENIASLEVHTAGGSSYSFIESILRGNKTTPRSIPDSHDTFDQTLSSLKYLLEKSVNIGDQLKQPGIASKVVSEQIAQALEVRMGLKELRR